MRRPGQIVDLIVLKVAPIRLTICDQKECGEEDKQDNPTAKGHGSPYGSADGLATIELEVLPMKLLTIFPILTIALYAQQKPAMQSMPPLIDRELLFGNPEIA